MSSWKRRTTWITATVALVAVSAGVTTALLPEQSAGSRGAEAITVGHGADRLPSTTASDWVTYADHVLVVSPVKEAEIAPSATELERGEGLINRHLTLDVKDVLWSRPNAPEAAPRSLDWQAVGWQFRNGDTADRVTMAVDDAPRLELGHTYVLAVVWDAGECGTNGKARGDWSGLGAGSVVPFDAGVIGNGELQGEIKDVSKTDTDRSAEASGGGPLEDLLAGHGARAIEESLANARTVHQRGAVADMLCR